MSDISIKPLTCPSCGAQVKIPEGASRFTCGYCGNEHLVQVKLEPVPAAARAPIRPKIVRPASVQVVKDGQGVALVQRWFSPKYIFMTFFVIVWDGFLIFWYSMAFGSGAPLIFKLFPIAHLAVGVTLTYTTLAGYLNRTNLELTRDELAVWFEPLPWPGEKTIQTADIKQLYCKENASHSRKGGTTYTYELHAVNRNDQDVKLLGGLESADIARYFEQTLEKWMNIENQPVAGEIE